MEPYIIDAANKHLGRVASEAAVLLMGKNTPAYRPNVFPVVKVTIKNAAKLDMRQKKLKQKMYMSYSGYPGGLTGESAYLLSARSGFSTLVRSSVKGMLPKNKLQDRMMKHLTVTED